MSCFVELWHDVIENQWNPCFDFLHCDIIMHIESGTAFQRQELLGFCLNVRWAERGNVCSVSGSSLGTTSSYANFMTVPCWSNFSMMYFIPPCFWYIYVLVEMVGQFSLGFHVTPGLPINFRTKWTLLDKKVRSHFVRAKHYQQHINLCQHLKWQTSCHGSNIQIHR